MARTPQLRVAVRIEQQGGVEHHGFHGVTRGGGGVTAFIIPSRIVCQPESASDRRGGSPTLGIPPGSTGSGFAGSTGRAISGLMPECPLPPSTWDTCFRPSGKVTAQRHQRRGSLTAQQPQSQKGTRMGELHSETRRKDPIGWHRRSPASRPLSTSAIAMPRLTMGPSTPSRGATSGTARRLHERKTGWYPCR